MMSLLKQLLLAVILVILIYQPSKAIEITVGDGTSTSTAPFHAGYLDAVSYFLYKKTEINCEGLIKSVAFNFAYANSTAGMSNFKIFMQNTDLTSISSPIESGWQLVYSDSIFTPATTGWVNFNFLPTDYFKYENTKNLLVKVCFNNDSVSGVNSTVFATTITGTSHTRRSNSGGDIDGCSSSMSTSTSLSRPNIKLNIELFPSLVTVHPAGEKLFAGKIIDISSGHHPSVEIKNTSQQRNCYISYSIIGPKSNPREVYYATEEGTTNRKIPITQFSSTEAVKIKFTQAFGDFAHIDSTLANDNERNTGQLDLTNPLIQFGIYTIHTHFEVEGLAQLTKDSTWEFQVNTDVKPIIPLNDNLESNLSVNFKWNKNLLATNYSLQIAYDSLFTNIVYNQQTVDTVMIVTSSITENKTCYWRVRGENLTDTSYWSEVRTFTTRPGLINTTLFEPFNNSIYQGISPQIKWKPQFYAIKYQLQLSTDTLFLLLHNNLILTDTIALVPNLEYSTKYFWRVRAINAFNDSSAWSSVWNFSTRPALLPPTLLTPRAWENKTNKNVQFTWKADSNATGAELQIATNKAFSTNLQTYQISSTSLNAGLLNPGNRYYSRVRSTNSTDTSDWSTILNFHTLKEHRLFGWGANNKGQLGMSDTTNKLNPVQIGNDSTWISISTGNKHTLGLRSDGTLWAWGYNIYGQLGTGSTANGMYPVQIGSGNDWFMVSGGWGHTTAIKNDGTLWAWGLNDNGQLGNGSVINRLSPFQIGTDSSWVAVSSGERHNLGLKSNGTLWAWGQNSFRQLGDGTTTNRYIPVQIGTDSTWISIATGGLHSMGLKRDSTLWAWGYNISGQLGDGSTTSRDRPVKIGLDTNWVYFTSGGLHTISLKRDGTIFAWGLNNYGQLGDGTNISRSAPVSMSQDNNWSHITGSYFHTVCIKNDGTLWATGQNSYGQLGDGTIANKNTLVQIGSITKWSLVESGEDFTVALMNVELINPVRIIPVNNELTVPVPTIFRWFSADNAISYQIQISTDSTFLSILQSSILTDTAISFSSLAFDMKYFWRVRTMNLTDTTTWSSVWSFRTRLQNMAPTLHLPENDQIDLPTDTQLLWLYDEFAIDYRIQIAMDSSFSYYALDTIVIDTTFSLTNLDLNQKYFWRVSANYSTDTSAWSSEWNFTTRPSLFDPILISPDDNALKPVSPVIFKWTYDSLAEQYLIQIASDSNFVDLHLNETVSDTCYKANSFTANTKYFWRIKAMNSSDTSDWSESRGFTAINSKSNITIGTGTSTGSAPFHTAYFDAASYFLYNKSEILSSGFISGNIKSISFHVAFGGASTIGMNNFKIFMQNTNFTSISGPVETGWQLVYSDSVYLTKPQIWNTFDFLPMDYFQYDTTKNILVKVCFNNSIDISGNSTVYCTSASGRTHVRRSSSANVDGCTSNMTNSPTTTYYPNIKLGVTGLEVPIQKLPDNLSTLIENNTKFTWSAIQGVNNYKIQLSLDSTFTLAVSNFNINDTTMTLSGLSKNNKYFWRIRSMNVTDTSHWSDKWSFFIQSLTTPELISIANNSTDVSTSPILVWKKIPIALFYRLQVSTDSLFKVSKINLIQSDTIKSISYLAYNTKYYWRVCSIRDDDTSSWSNYWSFTTEGRLFTQTIPLSSGWNMMSAYVTPDNPAMSNIISQLEVLNQITKNLYGQIYAPPFQNSLGLWNTAHAYQIRLSQSSSLALTGVKIIPESTPISLSSIGSYWLPYFRTSVMTTSTALSTISGKYLQIKSIQGLVSQPPFFNTLTQLQPNNGYIIRMTQTGTLTYPANTVTKSASADNGIIKQPQVFVRDKQITGKTAVIAMELQNAEDGDEIGVFTRDGMLVGSSVWQDGCRGVVVWGDDEYTTEKDGADEGEELIVKIWSNSTKNIGQVSQISLSDMTDNSQSFTLTYETDAVHLLKGTAELSEGARLLVIPQPATNEVFVEIPYLEDSEHQTIDIKLYNQAGQLVLAVESETNDKVIKLNTSNLSSGVYHLILNVNGKTYCEKVVVVK